MNVELDHFRIQLLIKCLGHAKSCRTSARVNNCDNGKIKGKLGWEEGNDCNPWVPQ